MSDAGARDRIKMPIGQLSIGMYVVELDRPWGETAFLFQGFRIRQQQEILLLAEVCQYVWVDARRSVGMQRQVEENLAAAATAELQPVIAKVDFNLEMQQAEPAFHSAREQSLRLLEAVRLGHELDVAQVKVVVKECVESMLRNPGAMLWLARIKHSDEYTAEHSLRVAIFSIALGRELGLRQGELEHLGMCGMLHDVGKIKVPSAILNKPGALTPHEMRVMQSHASEGRKLLMSNQQVTAAAVDVAFSHHERLDGSGYPHRLTGDKMSTLGKLLAATEEALAALRLPGATLHHASVALRVVPGEFDELLAGPLSSAARHAPPMKPRCALPALLSELDRLNVTLQETMIHVDGVLPAEPSAGLQRAADLTLYLLHKLRAGWNESGLWSPGAIGDEVAAEAEAVQDALRARLRLIERVARLTAGPNLSDEDEDRLNALCQGLVEEPSP